MAGCARGGLACRTGARCWSGRRLHELRRVRVVARRALLRPRVRVNHDLRLVRRPAGHLLVTERAELPGVGGYREFSVGRMIDARRHRHIRAAGIAAAGDAVTDFALHDLACIGAVVHALRPLRVAFGMTRFAIRGAHVQRLHRGDLLHRIAAIVTIAVEGIDREELLCRVCRGGEADHKHDEPNDMLGHESWPCDVPCPPGRIAFSTESAAISARMTERAAQLLPIAPAARISAHIRTWLRLYRPLRSA